MQQLKELQYVLEKNCFKSWTTCGQTCVGWPNVTQGNASCKKTISLQPCVSDYTKANNTERNPSNICLSWVCMSHQSIKMPIYHPQIANFGQAGILRHALSEYEIKSHNFTKRKVL